jgi:hypothetical protein
MQKLFLNPYPESIPNKSLEMPAHHTQGTCQLTQVTGLAYLCWSGIQSNTINFVWYVMYYIKKRREAQP